MARLSLLAGLMTATLMTQAAIPEWFTNAKEYFTVDALKNGLSSCSEVALKHGQSLKEAASAHPYIAAAIAVVVTGTGFAAKKLHTFFNARKNKVAQETRDAEIARTLDQDMRLVVDIVDTEANDAAYARRLAEEDTL